MSDFEAYYLWQNFWRQQPGIVKTLLDSLDILADEVQLDAFDAWYFENVLDQVPESHMTADKFPVAERKDKLRDIRAVVTHHIRVQLQNKRHTTLKEIRSKSKSLISAISNARLSNVSDELHILPAQSLSKLFPVVFCTPGQLRDYGYYFDTLLVSDNNGGDFQAYQAQSKQCVFVTNAISSGVINSQKDLKVARLQVMSIGRSFKWNDLPASDKLHLLNGLASQFAPYLDQIRIYNAREVQIFSFMGEITDAYLLKEIAMAVQSCWRRSASGGQTYHRSSSGFA